MKRNSRNGISGLLALGGACLLLAVFANAAPPDESDDSHSQAGKKSDEVVWGGDRDHRWKNHWRRDVNYVAGAAYTAFDDGFETWDITRTFAAVKTWQDVVLGEVHVEYHYEDINGTVFETEFVVKVDCLNIKRRTREAWIGGEVVEVTTNFGVPYEGMKMVFYVDDNHGGSPLKPDIHGSAWEVPETCDDRPDPFFPDPSHRGKIVVR